MPKVTTKSRSSSFWAMIARETNKYGLTVEDFKTNPVKLYAKSASYRSWCHANIAEPTMMKISGGKRYDMINAMSELPDNHEIHGIMKSEAPSSWLDLVHNKMEVRKQNQELQEIYDNEFTEELTEEMPSTSTDTKKTDEPPPKKTKTEQPSVADKFPKTKTDEPGKSGKKRPGGTTTDQDPAQNSKAPKKATSLTGTATSEEPPQLNPPGSQQIDTESGPEHNTGGTLQGESGNRKLQKKSSVFGLIEVMAPTNNTKTFFFGLKSEEAATNFVRLLNVIYPNQQLFTLKYITKLKVCELTSFFVIVKLSFNIGYGTLKSKVGKALDHLNYFWHLNFQWEQDEDNMRTRLHELIDLHVVNQVASLEWDTLIQQEIDRKNFRKNEEAQTSTYVCKW